MKIGDTVYVRGSIDEIRKDVVIIHNKGGYFGTVEEEIAADIGEYSDRLWKASRDRAFVEVIDIIDQMKAENDEINGEPIRTCFAIEYNDFRERVLALRGEQG